MFKVGGGCVWKARNLCVYVLGWWRLTHYDHVLTRATAMRMLFQRWMFVGSAIKNADSSRWPALFIYIYAFSTSHNHNSSPCLKTTFKIILLEQRSRATWNDWRISFFCWRHFPGATGLVCKVILWSECEIGLPTSTRLALSRFQKILSIKKHKKHKPHCTWTVRNNSSLQFGEIKWAIIAG